MEKFYYEVPSIERKNEAIEYIKEHIEYGSNINGSGGLDRYVDDYEGWLLKLDNDYVQVPNEKRVPARTYFLVRENDNKIIGMINIRLTLNESLKQHGGHIGYGIRPSERQKGYNKINLYLGLKVCNEYGIEEVQLDADLDNVASWKTMEALGGVRVKEEYDKDYNCIVVDYIIDVKNSLEKYKDIYEEYITSKKVK